MKNTIKAIGIVFIGMIIFVALAYASIAFIKAEASPFKWGELSRGVLTFMSIFALCGSLANIKDIKELIGEENNKHNDL